jgi:hypothetical protein
MPTTAFNRRPQPSPVCPWDIGVYLTDGQRLFYVVGVVEEMLQLEDSASECIESWALRQAVASLQEVKPCPASAS